MPRLDNRGRRWRGQAMKTLICLKSTPMQRLRCTPVSPRSWRATEPALHWSPPLPEGSESMVSKQSSGEALPFAVKSRAERSSGWAGQVLVAAVEIELEHPDRRLSEQAGGAGQIARRPQGRPQAPRATSRPSPCRSRRAARSSIRARFSGFSEDCQRAAACRASSTAEGRRLRGASAPADPKAARSLA